MGVYNRLHRYDGKRLIISKKQPAERRAGGEGEGEGGGGAHVSRRRREPRGRGVATPVAPGEPRAIQPSLRTYRVALWQKKNYNFDVISCLCVCLTRNRKIIIEAKSIIDSVSCSTVEKLCRDMIENQMNDTEEIGEQFHFIFCGWTLRN